MYIELYNSDAKRSVVLSLEDFQELINSGDLEFDYSIYFINDNDFSNHIKKEINYV